MQESVVADEETQAGLVLVVPTLVYGHGRHVEPVDGFARHKDCRIVPIPTDPKNVIVHLGPSWRCKTSDGITYISNNDGLVCYYCGESPRAIFFL